MFTSKNLKTLQHVSIIIQTIFRELVCFLLKSLILKFVKNVKFNVLMRQHNIWCVCVRSVWHANTPNVMLLHHHIEFYIFNKF